MDIKTEKTHWLQNPNKNYLGHWDLPNGEDVILEIDSAKWENVVNPLTQASESKRVIRFKDKYKWVKPFICNETNAKAIFKITQEKFMEDCAGKKIKISISKTRVKGDEIDCLRVKTISQDELSDSKISKNELIEIFELLTKAGKTEKQIAEAYKIKSLKELPKASFNIVLDRLKLLSDENN